MKIFIPFFPKNEEARVVIVNRVYAPAHGQGFYFSRTHIGARRDRSTNYLMCFFLLYVNKFVLANEIRTGSGRVSLSTATAIH